jgi:hypothetical protein
MKCGSESKMPGSILASMLKVSAPDCRRPLTHEASKMSEGRRGEGNEIGTDGPHSRKPMGGTPRGARNERDVRGNQAEKKRQHSHGMARTIHVRLRSGLNSGMGKPFYRVDQGHHVVIVSSVPRDPPGVWRARMNERCESSESADERESEHTPTVARTAVGTANLLQNPEADDRDLLSARRDL